MTHMKTPTSLMLSVLLTLALVGCANPFAKPTVAASKTINKPINKTKLSDASLKKVAIASQAPNSELETGAISKNYLDDVTTKDQAPPLQNPSAPLLPTPSNQPQLGPDPYQNIRDNLQRAYQGILSNPQQGNINLPRTSNP